MSTNQLIKNLRSTKLVAECPICQEEFSISDALLFDGMKKFPKAAQEKKLELLQELKERQDQLKEKKLSADVKAEEKAISVGFGKIIEKFIPAYKNLKLEKQLELYLKFYL